MFEAKPIPSTKIEALQGKSFTARQLKIIFGYSQRTVLKDTNLFKDRYIEKVEGTYPAEWRIV